MTSGFYYFPLYFLRMKDKKRSTLQFSSNYKSHTDGHLSVNLTKAVIEWRKHFHERIFENMVVRTVCLKKQTNGNRNS